LQGSGSDRSSGEAVARRRRRYKTTRNLLETADVDSTDATPPTPIASLSSADEGVGEPAAPSHSQQPKRKSAKSSKPNKKHSSKKKDKTKTKTKKRKKRSKSATPSHDNIDIGQPREEEPLLERQSRPQQQLRPSEHPPRSAMRPSPSSPLKFGADYIMTVQDDTVQTSPSVASDFASNYMVSPKSAPEDAGKTKKSLSSMIASSAVATTLHSARLSKKSLSSSTGSGFNSESDPGTPLEGMGRGRLGQSVRMYHDDAAVSPLPSVGASRGSLSSETGRKRKKRRSVMFAKETFLIEDTDVSNKCRSEDERSISMIDAAATSPAQFNSSTYFKDKLNVEENVMTKLESGLRSFSSVGDLEVSPESTASKPSLGVKSFADEFVVEPDEDDEEDLEIKPPARPSASESKLDTSNQGSQELTDAFVVIDNDDNDEHSEVVAVTMSPKQRYGAGKRDTNVREASPKGDQEDLQGSSQSLQFGNILLVDPEDPLVAEPASSEANMGRYSDDSGISIEPDADSVATPSTISDTTAGRRLLVHETSSGENTRLTTITASSSERSPMMDATDSIKEQTQPLILRNQISSLTVASDEGLSVAEEGGVASEAEHGFDLSRSSDLDVPLGLSPPSQRSSGLEDSDESRSTCQPITSTRSALPSYRDYVLPLDGGGSGSGSLGTASRDESLQGLVRSSDPLSQPPLRALPVAHGVEALGIVHEHSPPSVENRRNGYTSDESLRQLSVASSRDMSIVSLVDDARLAQTPIITGSSVSLVYETAETSVVWDALATGSVVAMSVSTEGSNSLVSSGGSSRGGAWRGRAHRQHVVSAAAEAASQVQSLVHEVSSRSGISSASSRFLRRSSGEQIASVAEEPMPAQALYPSAYDVEAAISDEVMVETDKSEENHTAEEEEIPMEELFKLYKKKAVEMEYDAKRESSVRAYPYFYSEPGSHAAAANQGQAAEVKARQQSMPNAQILSVVEEPQLGRMPDTYADDGSPVSSEDRWEAPDKRKRSKRKKKAPPRPRLNYWVKTSLIIIVVAVLVGLAGYFGVRFGVPDSGEAPNEKKEINRETLKQLVIDFDPETQESLETPESSSYKALDWAVSDINVEFASDETRLLRRFALATFYYSMSGENWILQDGWMSDSDECSWYTSGSSACNKDGSFVLLSLINNKLEGARIPRELALVDKLAWIDLSSNVIFDPFPSYLRNFSSLKNLFLASTGLSGTLPTEVGLLSDLQFLSLSKNYYHGSIPTEVGNLSELTYIDLSFNQLDGSVPTVLGRLKKLTTLRLQRNALTGSLPVQLPSTVTKMNLAGNKFSGTIPNWPPEFQFKELLLNNNNGITGTIPASLNEATTFDSPKVDLRGTSLSGSMPTSVCVKFSDTNGSIFYPCSNVTCAGQCCDSCIDMGKRNIFGGGQ